MHQLVKMLNNDYQNILQSKYNPKYHLFFDSYNWFQNALKHWTKHTKYENYDYDASKINNIKTINKSKYIPKKVASKKILNNIYSIISDPKITNFDTIRTNLNKLYEYLLPSTIDNLDDHLNQIKKSNKQNINVVIVGAGPIGLFTALYLNDYYNKYNFFNIKVNVLIIDNRTYEESIKLPYSRVTQFGFDISQIQPFINQIFCWKNKNIYLDRQFDFINVFENMLYLSAYHKKIPMYFTKNMKHLIN